MSECGHNSDEWGWEPLEHEDESVPNTLSVVSQSSSDGLLSSGESKISNDSLKESSLNTNTTDKVVENSKVQVTDNKTNPSSTHVNNVLSMKKGITSSPSFQELEKAIGATLEMSLGGTNDDADSAKNGNISASNSNSSLNSLTQHKIQQQRSKQKQQYQQYFSPLQVPNISNLHQNTRNELNIFTNENESRAIILFHSPLVQASAVRDACQKFGVLYYIRPEFHSKGVTLLCYFDLRSAIRAKSSLPTELGDEAEASAHYSIQLHASNSSSEEFRLLVHNIPIQNTETDVEAIFSRYGQLRSFEKHKDSKADLQTEENIELKNSADNSHSSYLVEFYNIQDARLAASELSASSSQIWDESATIAFAPLDSRKQQLCRILLTTLSKWRSELANFNYPVSPSSPRYMQWQQQMYQGNIPSINNSSPNVMVHPSYNPMPMPIQMMYTYPVQTTQMYQTGSTFIPTQIGDTSQIGLSSQIPQSYINYENKFSEPTDSQNFGFQKDNFIRSNFNYQAVPQQQHQQFRDENLTNQSHQQNKQYNQNRNNPTIFLPKYQTGNIAYPMNNTTSQSMYPMPNEMRPHHHNGGHGHNARMRSFTRPVPNNGPTVTNNFNQGQNSSVAEGNSVDSEFALDFDRLIEGGETRTTIMVCITIA